MAIKFKVLETPQPKERDEKAAHHARAVSYGTKGTNDLCKIICQRSSISPADVKAVLDSFVWAISFTLEGGYNVELEELGHFSPSLRSLQRSDGRLGIMVDGINFRCSDKLKNELKEVGLEKAKSEKKFTLQERKTYMLDYIKRSKYITVRAYAELNNCSRYRADADLKRFIEEGLICQSGGGTHVIYLLSEG